MCPRVDFSLVRYDGFVTDPAPSADREVAYPEQLGIWDSRALYHLNSTTPVWVLLYKPVLKLSKPVLKFQAIPKPS